MSTTILMMGQESVLTNEFFPPIKLDPDSEYSIGMLSFECYNSIPNVEEGVNNLFHFEHGVIAIPTGTYEIDDINIYLEEKLKEFRSGQNNEVEEGLNLLLTPNRNTLKTRIKANFDIYFNKPNSIGRLLGFNTRTVLKKNHSYESDKVINIYAINSILVECDLVTGSYKNGVRGRALHSFFPNVDAGYKLIEAPKNVLYLPINKSTDEINRITVSVLDENGCPISFRGETISVRLHLKNGY